MLDPRIASLFALLGLGHAGATGDWLVADGVARTFAGDAAVAVACAADANGMVVALRLPALAPGAVTLRIDGDGAEALELRGLVGADGVVALDDADEDRLWPRLLVADRVLVELRSDAGSAWATFVTAGFVDAFAQLGCRLADGCPMRSCGP